LAFTSAASNALSVSQKENVMSRRIAALVNRYAHRLYGGVIINTVR
jgi:hypothetical protein